MGPRGWTADDELDVRWFFCDAPGLAAGLRSNFGSQLEAIELGLTHLDAAACSDPDGAMVERLGHAARASRVHRVLQAMPAEHSEALATAYGGHQIPAAARTRFGDELAALVLAGNPKMMRLFSGRKVAGDAHEEAMVLAHNGAKATLAAAQASFASCRQGRT